MASPEFILALDQGTTSSRAVLFDALAQPIATAQQEFGQIYPAPGLVEHDPMTLWQSQRDAAVQVLQDAGVTAEQIAGVGITNQRETAVAWNRTTGKPICNAIVWQDRRTAGHIDRLAADGYTELLRKKTGLVPDAYFSATKFAWIMDHVEEAPRLAASGNLCLGTVDSWLVYNLTGGEQFITDATNASRTMLFDIAQGRWDDELLELFNIPRSTLPEVVASFGPFAEVSGGAIDELKGVAIAGIAGDQQAALFGQMCIYPGMVKNTYGTGCFILMNTGEEQVVSKGNLLTTIALQMGDERQYAIEGGVFIGGAVVQWLRDGLGIIKSSDEIEALANSVPDTGGVHLVPAFAGLGAPYWDQEARGLISGLTRGTTRAHLARAALESIAFQCADLLDAMRQDTDVRIDELRVDGGASSNDTLMQMQADILQIPVVRPTVTETTALGAAYLAGLSTSFWRSTDSLEANWMSERVFEPEISANQAAEAMAGWHKAIERVRL